LPPEVFTQADLTLRDPFDPIPADTTFNQPDSSLHGATTNLVAESVLNIPTDWTRSSSTPPPPYQQAVVNVESLSQPLPTRTTPPEDLLQPLNASFLGDPPQSHDFSTRHSVEESLRAELATERAKVAALERQLYGTERNAPLGSAALQGNEELSHDAPASNGRPAWYCRVCTLMNDDDLGRCGACDEQRPRREEGATEEYPERPIDSAETVTNIPLQLRIPLVDGTRDCVVCLDAERNAVLVHDSDAHHVVCMDCAEMLDNSEKPCPVCQRPIERILTYFC